MIALFDNDPVRLGGQGIEAGKDRRQVIGHLGQRQSLVAGVVEVLAVVPCDDDDAASLAAAGRLDDELLAMADQFQEFRHVAVPLDQGVGFRDGDLPPAAKLLGQGLVVHAGIVGAGIVGEHVLAVAAVDAQDAGLSQFLRRRPGTPHYSEHEETPLRRYSFPAPGRGIARVRVQR